MTRTVTLTIQRPTGQTEVVDMTERFPSMTPALFEAIKKATAEAGRGNVLSYEVTETDDRSEAEKAWDAISLLIARAEMAEERDPVTAFVARGKADAAVAEWRERYPKAAEERKREEERTREARRTGTTDSYVARGLD